MAGDWLKVEEAMPDKPEVFAIAVRLDIDPDAVAGKLIRVWSWASRNCHADGVTKTSSKRAIDRTASVTGFADAMIEVGWLTESGDQLQFPNFDRHNSETAKERGLAFIRKQKQRRDSRSCHDSVTEVSRSNRDKNGTKETYPNPEKRNGFNTPSPSTSSARSDGNGDGVLVMQWGKTHTESDLLDSSKIDEMFGIVVANGIAHDSDEDRARFFGLMFYLRRQKSSNRVGLLTRILEGKAHSKFHKSKDWRSRATDEDLKRGRAAIQALEEEEES